MSVAGRKRTDLHTPTPERPTRGAERARSALVEAATQLLPDRAPSTISGRELATVAGVNYGLIHHYFGSKDDVFAAGMAALRADFLEDHADADATRLVTDGTHPYLRALIRSHLDHPDAVTASSEFPLGHALVEIVTDRLRAGDDPVTEEIVAEAKARVIAMVSIQLCYGVFGPAMLDATGVGHRERSDVESALAGIFDRLSSIDSALDRGYPNG